MKTEEFDYHLPKELIAQTPLEKRDESRLLVMDRVNGDLTHKHFYDVIDYLNKGDALVINDTKVIPARIIGIKEETGAVIELLLLNPQITPIQSKHEKNHARNAAVGSPVGLQHVMGRCARQGEEKTGVGAEHHPGPASARAGTSVPQ